MTSNHNNEHIEVTEVNKIQECIVLFRKLSISKIDENVNAISNLIYEEDDLLNEFL